MKALQAKNSADGMNLEEIDEVIADLEKEKEDREFESQYNEDREIAAVKLESEGKTGGRSVRPLRVQFKRPPKTTDEAIETLREADQRFE